MEDTNTGIDQTLETTEGGQVENKGTSYTDEQIRELIQKSGDKRVSDALAKQDYKNKAKMAESEKLNQMDESQRKMYEYDQRSKAMDARESEFNVMRNTVEAQKVLATRGLPVEFVNYIVAEDADTMMANIETLEKAFKSAVNDAVSRKIASPTPKTGNAAQTGMTKESFKKLSIGEQSNLYKTNPNMYKEMTQ